MKNHASKPHRQQYDAAGLDVAIDANLKELRYGG